MNVETVTIKYDGEFHEFSVSDLDLTPDNPTDNDVKTAIIARLDLSGLSSLDGFVVDPPEAERTAGSHAEKTVLNIRPTATYG